MGERVPHCAFVCVFGPSACFRGFCGSFPAAGGCCPWARRSHSVPLCVFWAKCLFSLVLGFFSCRRWVLPLGEKVPHVAFVCVWDTCVFSLVLRFFSCRRWVFPLGEKVPHCAFVCVVGQVRVFLGSAVLFLPSVGVGCPLARGSHTLPWRLLFVLLCSGVFCVGCVGAVLVRERRNLSCIHSSLFLPFGAPHPTGEH